MWVLGEFQLGSWMLERWNYWFFRPFALHTELPSLLLSPIHYPARFIFITPKFSTLHDSPSCHASADVMNLVHLLPALMRSRFIPREDIRIGVYDIIPVPRVVILILPLSRVPVQGVFNFNHNFCTKKWNLFYETRGTGKTLTKVFIRLFADNFVKTKICWNFFIHRMRISFLKRKLSLSFETCVFFKWNSLYWSSQSFSFFSFRSFFFLFHSHLLPKNPFNSTTI